MTYLEGFLACLGLLLTPGPTNTLLALSAASAGPRAALRLMLAEGAGYLTTVLPLVLFGQFLVATAPVAVTALTLAASLWVAYLALTLWRVVPEAAGTGGICVRRVFVTTVLNPKGLLLGLFLLPSIAGASVPEVIGLALLAILIAACSWITLGGALRQGGQGALRQGQLRRGAALILGGLAFFLFQSGLSAAI